MHRATFGVQTKTVEATVCPSTTLHAPSCMMAQKRASFILVTIHAWRCAYCIHMQINIHKMANQFQHLCVIATVTVNAIGLQATVAMEASRLPRQRCLHRSTMLGLAGLSCAICSSFLYGDNPQEYSLAMQHQKAFRGSIILVYPSQKSVKIL